MHSPFTPDEEQQQNHPFFLPPTFPLTKKPLFHSQRTPMSTKRRPRWYPPPPPTPKILHLPLRTHRKPTRKPTESEPTLRHHCRGKLESLFDEERSFYRSTVPIVLLNSGQDCERRERVEDFEVREGTEASTRDFEEEKWRFQAEMLRAECNILRMERDIAVKKLELNRVQTKRTLKSAVETLISGKEKIYQGKSIGVVLEEEIEDLEENLKELQRSSSIRDNEVGKCSNFDKQASVLQKRLEKIGAGLAQEKCVKEIQEMAEASLTTKGSDCSNRFKDVEMLRRKLQIMSKGILERMKQEYGSLMSSSSVSGSATSSASTSRRNEFSHSSSAAAPHMHPHHQDMSSPNNRMCSGRCKKIVRKIVEQVRSEMEQWSLMQDMLGRVKDEMEELQTSRDFWQNRAFDSADRVQSLETNVEEWKQKASLYESKANELEKQISELRHKIGALESEQQRKMSSIRTRSLLPMPQGTQKEKEKKVLICSLKENSHRNGNTNKLINDLDDEWRKERACGSRTAIGPKRSPLQEIGNSSTLLKQNSRAVYSMQSPEISH